jgi:hypothetical protein
MMQSKSVKRPGILKFINGDTFDVFEELLPGSCAFTLSIL